MQKPLQSAAPAFRTDEPATYRLQKALTLDIASGKRAIGSLLPTEVELCAQSGLSRYAVRQVIGRLVDLGLVARQQGIGTTVLACRPAPRYVQSMVAFSDLMQYASGTEFTITEREQLAAGGKLCDLLACSPGDKWLKLSGVRRTSGKGGLPISLATIYVAARYSRMRGLSAKPKTPVYSLIETSYDVQITKVAQDVHGELVRGAQAKALEVDDGSPGLFIVRRYYIGEELVEVTTGLHPAERFSYSMAFQLAAAQA